MSVFDIIIIAIIGIFFVWGCIRGFTRLIFKVIVLLCTLAVCIFASRPIANQIMKTPLSSQINQLAQAPLEKLSIDGVFVVADAQGNFVIDINGLETSGGTISVDEAFSQFNIPSYLKEETLKNCQNGVELKVVLADVIAILILTGICAVVLGIVAAVVLTMIKFVLVKKMKGKVVAIDRVAGGVLNAVYAFLIISVIFAALNLVSDLSFMANINATIRQGTISNWFYSNNWFIQVLSAVSSLFAK